MSERQFGNNNAMRFTMVRNGSTHAATVGKPGCARQLLDKHIKKHIAGQEEREEGKDHKIIKRKNGH